MLIDRRRFSGDEAFDTDVSGPDLDAGAELGVVVKSKKKSTGSHSQSRL